MPIRGFSLFKLWDQGKSQVARCPWRTVEGWRRRTRYFFLRLQRLHGTSRRVAGGVAIGLFIGMTPTVPFQMVSALALAYCFRQSKVAAAIGTQIANPFLLPFIYLLDYQVGRWLVGASAATLVSEDFPLIRLIELGWRISYPLLVGGFVMGLLISIPTYFLAVHSMALYQRKVRKA